MLQFIKEGLDGASATSLAQPASATKGDEKKLVKLEEENDRLRAEYDRLKQGIPFDAIDVLKTFKLPEADGKKGKGKEKGKGEKVEEEEEEEAPEKKKKARKSRNRKPKADKAED